MYKNIVFDFGGVMVDFDPHKYLLDLFGNRGLEEEVYDLTFGSREWRLLDAGRITRREANERMLQRARAVGRGFEVEGVLDDWMSMLRPRRRMQTLVEQLKQRGYCVYYLSNIPEDVLDLLMAADEPLSVFEANCQCFTNRPLIGIITKIDSPYANVPMVRNWMVNSGCERIFEVSNLTREGIQELLDYLQEDPVRLTLEQAKARQRLGLTEWEDASRFGLA